MIARKLITLMFAMIFVIAGNNTLANAEMKIRKSVGDVTGLPIPRFVSTKSHLSNVRTGPGRRYPIRTTLTATVPLRIVDEYKDWRKIQDWDKQTGWVHKALLSSKRLGLIQVTSTKLYHTNKPSGLKAYLNEDIILKINSCDKQWCYVNVPSANIDGYVQQRDIWGLFPSEIIK